MYNERVVIKIFKIRRKELCLATLLNPRFKDNFFLGILLGMQLERCWFQLSTSPVTTSKDAAEEPGPSHLKRTCLLESTVLLDVISEIITDSNGDTPSTTMEMEIF